MAMDDIGAKQLVLIELVVRRVLTGRVPESAVDDLVQETLLRISEPASRLTAEELTGYAVVAARNAAASFHRTTGRHQRLQSGLIDLTQPEGPDAIAMSAEEAATMRVALAAQAPEDRDLLRAHHVDDNDVATLARQSGRSEMAVRLRLSRARARLRVDYTLARERAELPTARCRSVLLALSSGDRRAQERLEVDQHLETCDACRALVEPSTGRYRPVAGLLPALAWWWKGLSAAARRSITAGASGAVVAMAVGVAVLTPRGSRTELATQATTTTSAVTAPNVPAPAPATVTGSPRPEGRVRVPGGSLPSSPAGMGPTTGKTVVAEGAPVLAVPVDEGFWIAADDGGRLWVQLTGSGESPVHVVVGAKVTFVGKVVAHGPDLAGRIGVSGADARELTAQGYHVEVPATGIRVG